MPADKEATFDPTLAEFNLDGEVVALWVYRPCWHSRFYRLRHDWIHLRWHPPVHVLFSGEPAKYHDGSEINISWKKDGTFKID